MQSSYHSSSYVILLICKGKGEHIARERTYIHKWKYTGIYILFFKKKNQTLSLRATIQAVDEPLAVVLEWALSNTLNGLIESRGSSWTALTELDISSRAKIPALTPTSAQPPTPSATPITCLSAQIKWASSPPVSSLAGWGRYHDPETSFNVPSLPMDLKVKPLRKWQFWL